MSRRFFRRISPSRAGAVRQGWLGRWLGPVLDAPLLWQLNRKSVARGACSGVFWAFVPLPVQTVGAVLSAVWVRGNVPMAMLATWVSNPLTWVPIFYAGYRVGLAVTGQPEATGLTAELAKIQDEGLLAGTADVLAYFWQNLYRVIPLLLGNAMLGMLAAAAAYFGIKGAWRWNIVRRWGRRGHHVRCPHCRHLVLGGEDQPGVYEKQCPACGKPIPIHRRFGLGLAAISRKLREGMKRPAAAGGNVG